MTRTLLHPPHGVHSFTLHQGCGKPHEYDGEHGIDCGPCVEHVRLMNPHDRISQPHLRVPLVSVGDTPDELDIMRRAEEAKRHAASWRLVEAEDEPEPAAPSAPTTVSEALASIDAYEAGQAAAEDAKNPYDGRSALGKSWARGHQKVAAKA